MNTLAALALLAGHLAGRGDEVADGIRRAGAHLDGVAPDARAGGGRARRSPFAYTGRMFVIGRGVEFATAREIALKLLETCRVAAEPLTATDLAHGPGRRARPALPRLGDRLRTTRRSPTVQEAAARIRAMGATLVASGTAARRIEGPAYRAARSDAERALLSPLLSVVPGQLFAAALARARGLDPDAPHGLAKVTLGR